MAQKKLEKPVDSAVTANVEARRRVDALRAAGVQLPLGTAKKLAQESLHSGSAGGQSVERILTTQLKPGCPQRRHLTRQVPVVVIGKVRRAAEKARMADICK